MIRVPIPYRGAFPAHQFTLIHSMTGYAVATTDLGAGSIGLELKSVNARFLDLQFRVADELRALEPLVRERIAARLARGKIDCRLHWNAAATASQRLNAEAIGRLKAMAAEAAALFPQAAPLRIADVLRWPGALEEIALEPERLRDAVAALAERALDELCATRAREGAKLEAIVRERLAEMRRRLAAVAPLVPEAAAAYRAKLAERLREALGAADEERLRAEAALFAAKTDIDEELERLAAHLDEVERVLETGGAAAGGGGPVGKRLDFLAQELNREANTLAAKAAARAISDCALELKLLVEQLREQAQNIE